jgi:hypothetical protein
LATVNGMASSSLSSWKPMGLLPGLKFGRANTERVPRHLRWSLTTLPPVRSPLKLELPSTVHTKSPSTDSTAATWA